MLEPFFFCFGGEKGLVVQAGGGNTHVIPSVPETHNSPNKTRKATPVQMKSQGETKRPDTAS